MDLTQIYAIIIASIALSAFLINLCLYLSRFKANVSLWISKVLIFRYVLDRHALIGPWSWAYVLLQTVYLTLNIFFLCFRVADLPQVGLRAGTLSLINLGPLFASLHIDFLADLLRLSLETCQCVHRSASFATVALAALHVLIVAVTRPSFFRELSLHPFIIIVRVLRLQISFMADALRQV